MPMNPELKSAWIADLRANGDLQGQVYLHSADGKFCCLGRARVVAGMKWGELSFGIAYMAGNNQTTMLCRTEMIEIGITTEEHQKLADMNDTGKTFAEIANWIEENL